ncbi:MAG TPA: methyltransferase domain-containing protein [Spirochaetia bacterium]|nr:methyltransferase domain-containing protein [Spirochaetia bacterium]
MTALIFLLVVALGIYLLFYVFFPLGRGAIYEPSSREKTIHIAELADVKEGERTADLGSGDGRVVIALAQCGAEAHGYEINPLLVLRARANIRKAGLSRRAFIHWGSFWRADLSAYDLITVFQVGFIMGRLENKLQRELRPGSRVVSHYWRFPTLQPEKMRGDVYRYRIVAAGRGAHTIPGRFEQK